MMKSLNALFFSLCITLTSGFGSKSALGQSSMPSDSLRAGINEFIDLKLIRPYVGKKLVDRADSLLASAYYEETSRQTLADLLLEMKNGKTYAAQLLEGVSTGLSETSDPVYNVFVTDLLKEYCYFPEKRDALILIFKSVSDHDKMIFDRNRKYSELQDATRAAGIAYTFLSLGYMAKDGLRNRGEIEKVFSRFSFRGFFSKIQASFVNMAKSVNFMNTEARTKAIMRLNQEYQATANAARDLAKGKISPGMLREFKKGGMSLSVGAAAGLWRMNQNSIPLRIDPMEILDYFQAILVLELEDSGLALLERAIPLIKKGKLSSSDLVAIQEIYQGIIGHMIQIEHFIGSANEANKTPSGRLSPQFMEKVDLRRLRAEYQSRSGDLSSLNSLKKDLEGELGQIQKRRMKAGTEVRYVSILPIYRQLSMMRSALESSGIVQVQKK
jgi:hypothetical protein